jgi:protein-S-isoprenylcysteine O-methyltransferase Ste14
MISPFALHYYAAYGPSLNVLHRWRGTAWLTDFFLPHFSDTGSAWLDGLHAAAGILIVTGLLVFGLAFLQVYGAKLANRGLVTGGLYGTVRHPQYVGLAILGLGTLLLWPRVLVLIAYLTMLFLYGALARREEARCLARFGEPYRRYLERTSRFVPGRLGTGWPRFLPAAGRSRRVAVLAVYLATLVAGVGLAYALREYSLARVTTLYTEEAAVLSPARLSPEELRVAFEVARGDARVHQVLEARGGAGGKLLVYVVPLGWMLPDLPLDATPPAGGHAGHVRPADFERGRYRVLFTRARTHHPETTGPAIIRTAYGREPLVVATVDTGARQVTGIATPPPHVRWGDIPTPLF